MKSSEKKREIVRYVADINDPAAIDSIHRRVYKHFIKATVSVEPDYFGKCLKSLPDVPDRYLRDVYTIIKRLVERSA